MKCGSVFSQVWTLNEEVNYGEWYTVEFERLNEYALFVCVKFQKWCLEWIYKKILKFIYLA